MLPGAPECTYFRSAAGVLELGDGRRATTYLERGLTALPESYRRDRAWYGACLARAHAIQGDAEAAVATALNTAPDATELNPYALAELQRTAQDLAWVSAPGAQAIKDSLTGSKP